MNNSKRKNFTPEEKVSILRWHLIEKTPVSNLCEEFGSHPTMFYRWLKQFFEIGQAAFQNDWRNSGRERVRSRSSLNGTVGSKLPVWSVSGVVTLLHFNGFNLQTLQQGPIWRGHVGVRSEVAGARPN